VPTSNSPAPASTKVGLKLVVMLGSLTAFGPMTIDLYLPALPRMTEELGTTESRLQLTLTACLIGLAVGQVIIGPISDAVGRRKPLLVGMAIYTVASIACAVSPNVELLIAARVVQALAAAAGQVTARAIIRDLVSGAEIARLLSLLMLVTGVAPILAPVVGGQLLRFGSWRLMFVVLAIFGAVLFFAVWRMLPDTLAVERRRQGSIRDTLGAYGRVARDRYFLGYALATAIGFAAMFAYLSGSSFVYQDVFDISPQWYGVLFGLNGLGLVIVSQINGRLVRRFDPHVLLDTGQVIGLCTAVVMLLSAITGIGGTAGVLVPLFLTIASRTLVMPNATALGLTRYPDAAGTASAMQGTLQFVIASAVGPLVTMFGVTSAVPMCAVMVGCLVLSLLVRIALTRNAEQERATSPS
jgi:DHA1 family bicyclomycin/chloramphenicol resistance-like MFS transporter